MDREYHRDGESPKDPVINDSLHEEGIEAAAESEEILDLVDVIEDDVSEGGIPDNNEMRDLVIQTTERIARELFPGIAAAIVREEIEKLKGNDEEPR